MAEVFPDLPPTPLDVAGLDARDARLALAIHRNVLQRWITLEHLLDRFLKQPCEQLEPALRGLMLSAAAQLVFMDRLPAHAVVDESVKLARRLVRPNAAGLVNAVLRRVAQLPEQRVTHTPWSPAADRLPTDDGLIPLSAPALPNPGGPNDLAAHLSVATSHPLPLVQQWINDYGEVDATRICVHGVATPPIIVAVEPGFDIADSTHADDLLPHNDDEFVIWAGSHDGLTSFLDEHEHRRVQDPSSTLAVNATRGLDVRCAIDYCAGRGTKTRQLLSTHPNATVIASDTDPARMRDLHDQFDAHPRVEVMAAEAVAAAFGKDRRRADLVLLDVPCGNTAVLARRPEARYRHTRAGLRRLSAVQRTIIDRSAGWVEPDGAVLYATCSLSPVENERQSEAAAGRYALRIEDQRLTLPGGAGRNYRDGSFYALLKAQPGGSGP